MLIKCEKMTVLLIGNRIANQGKPVIVCLLLGIQFGY